MFLCYYFYYDHGMIFINIANMCQLSFQDDITSTDESQVESCDESSNDENFLIQNQQLQQRTAPVVQQVVAAAAVPTLRNFEKEKSQQLVQHQISEKMMDNHKLLLESLSNLPQNILQSWIQSGQLQVSMDEGNIII